ncbi:AbrB/MazE/SpoVT family DNA-binding domain-containing protein [Moraxella catarrhalis]|jgi:antitoxin MazE|uniref:AbrB/MazE/SpoVT family DNA-binding domain-containing protein n=1 Tax=Moraxella catarrhalis TaxID=480 RepID=UPI000B2E5FE9|nr:AbrB/MazE/SpoVT family DNA-binding domain-containing protein [Moraxella catarrhalis]MPW49452.1 AbrB/MazE/SpoVT family DNA-binding domain-containing protein [Moraxella catarrhalis]MPW56000.1 AbrB/MazE/SpoVT family DNA-binding domain-containing protein [Moraxella catarrhalis]MPW59709.1 AbrB/MazE/SpoVT family DNA-binding domain-containing protein [Moraxella catarrhalis]MPW62711.1 AbrB/MazE/SpoVT family DNA-binding domain-containing protein [Moraxella catarrhalis]MPW87886.1 AbrB/MazE/SpoVT fami
MITNVAQWGNSMALRIPNSIIKQTGMHKGCAVEIHVNQDMSLTIRPKKHNLNALLAQITDDNLPDYEDDEPCGSEVW